MTKKNKVEETISSGEVLPEEIMSLMAENPELDVTKMYHDAYDELVALKAENVDKAAINKTKVAVRRQTKKAEFIANKESGNGVGKVEVRTGIVIGDTGIFDKLEMLRNMTRKYINENGMRAAIDAQMVNSDGKVLDSRPEMFGKTNKRLGNVVNPNAHERSRTLYMIARSNGTGTYKVGTMQTNDNVLALGWGKVHFFEECQVPMIIKEEDEDTFRANASTAEETKSIFKAVKEQDFNVDEVFMDAVLPKLTEIKDVEEVHEQCKNEKGKMRWDKMIFVKGIVLYLGDDKPSPIGTVKMRLMSDDGDYEVLVEVPEHIATNFGESSEIVVLGKTSRADLRDEDENGKLVYRKGEGEVKIDALGIYCIPGACTPKSGGTSEVLQEEEPIDGWVP